MSLIVRERLEEMIDRTMASSHLFTWRELQDPAINGHASVWRDHINMIWLDASVVGNFEHRHLAGLCQQLGQLAFVLRVKVLHQHKRHARVRW